MHSLVIKTAMDVKSALELVNTIPMLGFLNDSVEIVTAHPDPNEISAKINNFFYLDVYTSCYNIH